MGLSLPRTQPGLARVAQSSRAGPTCDGGGWPSEARPGGASQTP
jgi:hypothetical protein